MRILKRAGIFLCFLASASCATRSHPPVARRVPPARVFAPTDLRPSSRRNCAITLAREPGVIGAGLNIFLDGREVARISAGEAATFYVRPGRHMVSARPLFSPATGELLALKSGDKIALRVVDRDGNFHFEIAERSWLTQMKSWLTASR